MRDETINYKLILKNRFDPETGEIVTDIDGNRLSNDIVICRTLEECSRKVSNYISQYNISCNQWNGGQVYKENKYIGRIWYDGVFYEPSTEKGKLPKLQEQIDEAVEIKEVRIAKSKRKQRQIRSG